MTDVTVKYLVVNHGLDPMNVIVEPWAEEVVLAPESELLVTVLCDREGMLEIAPSSGFLTIWVWTGCRAMLALNGKDLALPWLLMPSP